MHPEAPGPSGSDRSRGSLRPPTSGRRERQGGAEDGSRIDILVRYDPDARAELGGHAKIKALIDLAVAGTNQAYAKSGVVQRLHLVGALQADLPQPYEEEERMRDRWAADFMVSVWQVDPDYCGGGSPTVYESLDGELVVDPTYAYAGVSPSCLEYRTVDVFAHELGHSMGLWHDRYVVEDYVMKSNFCYYRPCVSFKPYSYGYVNQRGSSCGRSGDGALVYVDGVFDPVRGPRRRLQRSAAVFECEAEVERGSAGGSGRATVDARHGTCGCPALTECRAENRGELPARALSSRRGQGSRAGQQREVRGCRQQRGWGRDRGRVAHRALGVDSRCRTRTAVALRREIL